MAAPVQRFLISAVKSGLQKDKDTWLIMDDAWDILKNVHVWREKVIKRFGAIEMNSSKSQATRQQFTRLRLNIGITAAVSGNFAIAAVPGVIFKIGQMFSVGNTYFTVYQNGATYTTGAATATYNTATGALTITGNTENPLTVVYFYPAEPVMALPSFENAAINAEQLVAFDTQFSYTFTFTLGWQSFGPVSPAAGSGLWTGNNHQFHSVTNYRGVFDSDYTLFVVNGVVADQIQYFFGGTTTWTRLVPVYETATGFVIRTAKIIVSYRDRLLLFHTTEQTAAGDRTFPNRIRFSQNGDPTVAATSWLEEVGRGGFIDLPTRELIISVVPIKDSLVIYCERSTWALEYNGNEIEPFRYRQINAELGVESQNSTLLFDKAVIGMGSTGIHASNGINVDRIDDAIPNIVFDIINNNDATERVCAVRDYWTEEIYWSYSSSENSGPFSQTFPNSVLVFNYKTGAWAINDDSITALGYYQKDANITWADMTTTWAQGPEIWADPSDIALFRDVVAGNQEGFTFIIPQKISTNSMGLSITDIAIAANIISIKAIDHNLKLADFIYINNAVGMNNFNDEIYRVQFVQDKDVFQVQKVGVTGPYQGGGTIVRVSKIEMQSKQYNFFNDTGKKIEVPRIDFLVETIAGGKIQFNYLSSFSDQFLNTGGNTTGASLGTNILDLDALNVFARTQTKIWRSMFPFWEGENVQYNLVMTDPLMLDKTTAFSDFRLHAVLFYARQTSDFGS